MTSHLLTAIAAASVILGLGEVGLFISQFVQDVPAVSSIVGPQ